MDLLKLYKACVPYMQDNEDNCKMRHVCRKN